MSREPVAFFVGSYISVWPPAEVPSVWALRKSIVDVLLQSSPSLSSIDHSQISTLLDGAPRLETIVEELEYRLGPRAVDFLNNVRNHPPNYLHNWLAKQFVARRITDIYTTNFDTCIESALTNLGWFAGTHYTSWITDTKLPAGSTLPCIYHLHGSIEVQASVCATLITVARQRSAEWASRLSKDLAQHPFCFLGYSGLDIDVRPVLFRSSPKQIFWVDLASQLSPPTHICNQLAAQGKFVTPVASDLTQFPTTFGDAPLTRYSPKIEIKSLLPFARTMTESCKLYTLSRMLWRLCVRAAEEADSVLTQAHELTTTPSDRWPVYYQHGTAYLGRSRAFANNAAHS